jgi:ParB/RepB/Spo0J family partition protein
MKKPELLEIPVDKLIECNIQPQNRHGRVTDNTPLTKLIEYTKVITPLLVKRGSSGEYIICDGHRRLAACKILGYATVPCLVVDSDITADDLLILINEGVTPFNSNHKFEAWAASPRAKRDHLANMIGLGSPTMEKHIRRMSSIFGVSRAVELAHSGRISPTLSQTTTNLFNVFENSLVRRKSGSTKKQDTSPTVLEIGEYLVKSGNRITLAKTWLKTSSKSVLSNRRFMAAIRSDIDFLPDQWLL